MFYLSFHNNSYLKTQLLFSYLREQSPNLQGKGSQSWHFVISQTYTHHACVQWGHLGSWNHCSTCLLLSSQWGHKPLRSSRVCTTPTRLSGKANSALTLRWFPRSPGATSRRRRRLGAAVHRKAAPRRPWAELLPGPDANLARIWGWQTLISQNKITTGKARQGINGSFQRETKRRDVPVPSNPIYFSRDSP